MTARALAKRDEKWRGLPRDGPSQHRSKMPCPFSGQSSAHESQPHPWENALEHTLDRGWVWNLVLILGIQPAGKESACQCRRPGFDPWVGKIPWRRKWQPTPVFLPGESHGQRSLAGLQSMGWQRVGHD